MADYTIRKGFDLRLDGRPAATLADAPQSPLAVLQPLEFTGIKQRLLVREGDTVKRGTPLVEDKRNPALKLRAPAAGTIESIIRGDRRLVERIVIRTDRDNAAESLFPPYTPAALAKAGARALLAQLVDSGFIVLIRQRPFSGIADPEKKPGSIFVNAMNTAPFEPDPAVVVADDPAAFQAGLDALTQLTDGAVHLCIGSDAAPALRAAQHVQIHTFSGPHPSGNTSVHISRVAPMAKTDVVWTVRAADAVRIGRLFLDGRLPPTRIVALGGTGVRPEARRHYRLRAGASLKPLLDASLLSGDYRLIQGNVLSGSILPPDAALSFFQGAINAIPEGHNREFLGWLAPGLDRLSFLPTYLSTWFARTRTWALNTSKNGGDRAMVLTGLYDRVMPLNIMVDFLIRAVLAGDTEEAIKLGILETDPEDFALCDFICPCKTEIQTIIRKGLLQIEAEGL